MLDFVPFEDSDCDRRSGSIWQIEAHLSSGSFSWKVSVGAFKIRVRGWSYRHAESSSSSSRLTARQHLKGQFTLKSKIVFVLLLFCVVPNQLDGRKWGHMKPGCCLFFLPNRVILLVAGHFWPDGLSCSPGTITLSSLLVYFLVLWPIERAHQLSPADSAHKFPFYP